MDKNSLGRRKKLVDAIMEYWQWLDKRQGKRLSNNELARHFGVSPTSLSNWINMMRDPAEDNLHRLADKMGPKIYDIMGVPRRLSDEDDLLNEVVDILSDPTITAEDRKEILEFARSRKNHGAQQPALGTT